jgi:cysteine desulfurase
MHTLYLDHAATTPVRDEVREAMAPYADSVFGNASSLHGPGQAARAALDGARAEVAAAIGARPSEIRFVRGGTESANLAIIGGYRAQTKDGPKSTVVVSAIEHSAVLEPARHLADRDGARVTIADVGPDGSMDLDAVEELIDGGSGVLSVMWVNNETGMTLPIGEVAGRFAGTSTVLHTDASQAIGKVPVNVRDTPVDLLTGTAHKIQGPKGAGFLYVRDGVEVEPLLYGGSQERGLRPGTEDVAGAVGLATAVRLAVGEAAITTARMSALRATLEARLTSSIPGIRINAGEADRAPHVSSLGVPGIEDGAALLMALDLEGLAVSGGSACNSGSNRGSHVMAALYGDDDPYAVVRVSFGRATTEADVIRAAEIMEQVIARFRGASARQAV